MSPEEQRIVIAEACGWRWTKTGGLVNPKGEIVNNFYSESWRLPDYLNDLNAMHEAEKILDEKQQIWYIQKLGQIILRVGEGVTIACILDRLVFATASQRADAFLRTLGRCKEEE